MKSFEPLSLSRIAVSNGARPLLSPPGRPAPTFVVKVVPGGSPEASATLIRGERANAKRAAGVASGGQLS